MQVLQVVRHQHLLYAWRSNNTYSIAKVKRLDYAVEVANEELKQAHALIDAALERERVAKRKVERANAARMISVDKATKLTIALVLSWVMFLVLFILFAPQPCPLASPLASAQPAALSSRSLASARSSCLALRPRLSPQLLTFDQLALRAPLGQNTSLAVSEERNKEGKEIKKERNSVPT
ncbi:hypothetical protein CMV_018391 [Castanea mollissima]|uniref:Transmembrane protein n=1 Tax=Castanea mollissima TaxID=60419 RepID=A0A8J4R023_9ROSI|nr:hypothetical protein CMV_018391 [Castanea mollissima]